MLENDANQARFIGPGRYTAQWNDDSHHGYHVLATGEADGYYVAYADAPAKHLARCLAEGFAYQGEVSPFSKEPRGEPSAHLPPSCFVDFMQNHDQVGNRAFGERIAQLSDEQQTQGAVGDPCCSRRRPPLLFMGEEWGCQQPFLFFCDFEGELGEAVRKGRREEFSRFASFKEFHSGSAGREHVQADACSTGTSATPAGSRTTRSCSSSARAPSRRASSARASTACSASAPSR